MCSLSGLVPCNHNYFRRSAYKHQLLHNCTKGGHHITLQTWRWKDYLKSRPNWKSKELSYWTGSWKHSLIIPIKIKWDTKDVKVIREAFARVGDN